MEWYSLLFYLLFVGQILLISYWLPRRMSARVASIFENYPPAEYPKLYPRSLDYYQLGHSLFVGCNRAILLLGFGILLALLTVVDHATFADDGFISEAWPAGYGMIQALPFVLLECIAFSQFRLMRATQSDSTRKAELRPRRFFDAASPRLVVAAVAAFLLSVGVDLWIHDFVLSWDHDTTQRAFWLVVGNLFMVSIGLWQLYGRKQDPYQSFSDRARQTRAQWTSLLSVSIVMSFFMLSTAVDDVADIDFLDAPLMSLYFQIIVLLSIGLLLRTLRPEEIDFEVYRERPAET